MPKLKGFTLYNPELTHILRSPPASIHTRKKERVDESDTLYMIRNDDTRINEGVSYLARGTNPMVDISYNNMGGASRTNTMANVQASNPYKVAVVRPPLVRQEDLLPLSRMRRPETMAITNPGIRNGMAVHDLSEKFDKANTFNSIDKTKRNYSVRPTASYSIAVPLEIFTGGNVKDKNNYSMTSAISSDYKSVDDWRNIYNPKEASKDSKNIYANTNLEISGDNYVNRENPNEANGNRIKTSAISNILLNGNNKIDNRENPNEANGNQIKTSAISNILLSGNNKIDNRENPNEANGNQIKTSAISNILLNGNNRGDNAKSENYLKDNLILRNISPNFSIQIFNPNNGGYIDLVANTKDKLNIAVQTTMGNPISLLREDGTPIKLKDYTFKVVNSNVGMDKLILLPPSYEFELERNIPLYAVGSNTSSYTTNERDEINPITGELIRTSASSAVSSAYGRKEAIHDVENREGTINLKGMGNTGYKIDNIGNVPSITRNKLAVLNTNKNENDKYARQQYGNRYDYV